MALADCAAELFMVGYLGAEPEPALESLIRDQGLAGVILFSRNLITPQQVRAVTNRLQSLSRNRPLLVATDQEGGVVSRLAGGARQAALDPAGGAGMVGTPWPGAMTLGACGSTDLAREVALGTGRELRALGINMNLAPVIDVNSNPANPVILVRSFGEEPERVAASCSAVIAGLQEAGVLATAKHFPGLGDTSVDALSKLASVAHNRPRLDAVELVPFREAIAAGVDAIMATHVLLPAVEPDHRVPAMLSPTVLTGLLRQELGFDGLIVTDSLEMQSVRDLVGTAEAAVQALIAGADLLLVPDTLQRQVEAIEAVRTAIRSGRIPAERVGEALQRVRAVRQRLAQAAPAPALSALGCRAHVRLAERAAEGSITAVGHLRAVLPVDPDRTVLTAVDPNPLSQVEEREPMGSPVLTAMTEMAPKMRRMGISRQPTAAEILRAIEYTSGNDLVLVATYSALFFAGQADLVRLLVRSGRRVVVIGQRGAYGLMVLPGILGAVIMYEDRLLTARGRRALPAGPGTGPRQHADPGRHSLQSVGQNSVAATLPARAVLQGP